MPTNPMLVKKLLTILVFPACGLAVQAGVYIAKHKALHDGILMGTHPPRFVVAYIDGGLADSLAGAVSAFYYALITERAFQILGERWHMAYRTRSIDWRNFQNEAHYQRLSSLNSSDVSYVVEGHHRAFNRQTSELHTQFAA